MRWEDERYVRLYTRDTATWLMLPWQSRFVLMSFLRKVDRAGLLELGGAEGNGIEELEAVLGVPAEVLAVGLSPLLSRSVLARTERGYLLVNFLDAQEAKTSDKERQRKSRELARSCHKLSQPVTDSHTASQTVTPSLAVPSRAEPCRTEPSKKPSPASPSSEGPADQGDGWGALVEALFAAFVEIHHKRPEPRGKDWKALKRLRDRTKRNDSEIIARFRRGLVAQFKQHVDSFWDLDDRWDALASAGVAPPAKVVDFRKSPIRAEDVNQAAFARTGDVTNEF